MKKGLISAIFGASLFFNTLFSGEPIVFIAIEKSASVYIQWQLMKSLRYQFREIKTVDQDGELTVIDEDILRGFAKENCVLRGHYYPTRENIDVLKKYQLKAIFHVRDLRQRVVSFAHYQYRLVRKGTIPCFIKGKTKMTITLQDMIDYYISKIEGDIRNIEGWLEVYENGEVPLLLTTYEQFHDDPQLFYQRILSFYEIPIEQFNPIEIPKIKDFKFRKGMKDEWKRVLTPEQIERINQQIPDRLFDFFGWER